MTIFAIDWAPIATGLGGIFAAIAIIVPLIIRMTSEMKKAQNDTRFLWHGIIKRGYVEAQKMDCLKFANGKWVVSKKAREVYKEIMAGLVDLREEMARKSGVDPDDVDLSWAIEGKHQQWMADTACPVLGVHSHGCLAVACVLAREAKANGKSSKGEIL